MGQALAKETSKIRVEQAKAYHIDPTVLNTIRDAILANGQTVTLTAAKGSLSLERLVYPGDVSLEVPASIQNMVPLFSLEYSRKDHIGVVKDAATGNVLMMMVHERNDEAWYGGGNRLRCGFGANTDTRLYLNGRPVGVAFRKDLVDVSLSTDKSKTGASTKELVRIRERSSSSNYALRRQAEGGPGMYESGSTVAVFAHVKVGAVLRMVDADDVDPVALIAMTWYMEMVQI